MGSSMTLLRGLASSGNDHTRRVKERCELVSASESRFTEGVDSSRWSSAQAGYLSPAVSSEAALSKICDLVLMFLPAVIFFIRSVVWFWVHQFGPWWLRDSWP